MKSYEIRKLAVEMMVENMQSIDRFIEYREKRLLEDGATSESFRERCQIEIEIAKELARKIETSPEMPWNNPDFLESLVAPF